MERAIVSAQSKREYVQAIYQRYRHAARPGKGRILDEFCHVTRSHRKHAIRLLNGPAPGAARQPHRRARTYRPAVIDTRWVETAAVLGKSQVVVQQALEELREALPFRLPGHRLGQRLGVHQPASLGLLSAAGDSVHPGPALQEG